MKINLIKIPSGAMIPADQEATEVLQKIKSGECVTCEIKQPRNVKFHRKLFALLDVAFEAWDAPELEYKDEMVHKNRERFRHDVTILAGYYTTSVNLRGEVRLDAKSISFAKMSQEDFELLYDRIIDVILQKVLTHYTKDDLQKQVDRILMFD